MNDITAASPMRAVKKTGAGPDVSDSLAEENRSILPLGSAAGLVRSASIRILESPLHWTCRLIAGSKMIAASRFRTR